MNFQLLKPTDEISDFVYCFTSLQGFNNLSDAVVIPNGRIDLSFSLNKDNTVQVSLLGLETKPKYPTVELVSFYSISFNPLAIEYIFDFSVSDIVNSGKVLTDNFWEITADDLKDFESFCKKTTQKILNLVPNSIDERKRLLFEHIFKSNGQISINNLSEIIHWSPRQINRYFNHQFGVSLKLYCKILRFQASLIDIKNGNLYPQLNFTDQSHFIKDVKNLAGVSPKELHKNPNDRFLQFLMYNQK